jgi:hypothetical protein
VALIDADLGILRILYNPSIPPYPVSFLKIDGPGSALP